MNVSIAHANYVFGSHILPTYDMQYAALFFFKYINFTKILHREMNSLFNFAKFNPITKNPNEIACFCHHTLSSSSTVAIVVVACSNYKPPFLSRCVCMRIAYLRHTHRKMCGNVAWKIFASRINFNTPTA